MGVLDQPLGPGEQVTIDETFINELVGKLQQRNPSGTMRISPSTHLALVHPDDDVAGVQYPLMPSSVVIKDLTPWSEISKDNVVVEWTISGVGHLGGSDILTTDRTFANGSVSWSWAADDEAAEPGYTYRDWAASISGTSLPTTVVVTAVGKYLTSAVTESPVDTTAALAAVVSPDDQEVRYVLETDKVYTFTDGAGSGDIAGDGGYWDESLAVVWDTYDTTSTSILIDRGYDPNYYNNINIMLAPEREAVFLDGGSGTFTIYDGSTFPSDATVVERELEIQYDDGSSAGLTVLTEATEENLLTLAPEEKEITIISEKEGVIEIKATYTVTTPEGDTDYISKKVVRVWSASSRGVTKSGTPSLPSAIKVNPGNGSCNITLGQKAEVYRIKEIAKTTERSEPDERYTRLPPPSLSIPVTETSQEINKLFKKSVTSETGEEGQTVNLTNLDLKRLNTAASYVKTATRSLEEASLRAYEVSLRFPDENFVLPKVGEMLFAGNIVGRITYVDRNDGQTYTFRMKGWAPTSTHTDYPSEDRFEYITDGFITAAADSLSAVLTFGFGDINDEDFPRVSFDKVESFDPDAGISAMAVTLPSINPITTTEGWYVKGYVKASWDGETPVSRSIDWTQAEVVPEAAPSLVLTQERGDVYHAILRGGADYDFYGTYTWVGSDESTKTAREVDIQLSNAISRDKQVHVPSTYVSTGAYLRAIGYFRSKGGTPARSQSTAVSQLVYPNGGAVINSTVNSNPPVENAPSGVSFLSNPAGFFVSVNNQWLQLGDPVSVFVTNLTISENGGADVNAIKLAKNAYKHNLGVVDPTNALVAKVHFEGPVRDAFVSSGPAHNGVFENGTFTITVPPSALPTAGEGNSRSFNSVFVIQATDSKGQPIIVNLTLTPAPVVDTTPPKITSLTVQDAQDNLLPVLVSGPTYLVKYDPNTTGGDLLIKATFADKSGVNNAYVSTGDSVVTETSFANLKQELTVVVEDIQDGHILGIKGVDGKGNASDEIPILFESSI